MKEGIREQTDRQKSIKESEKNSIAKENEGKNTIEGEEIMAEETEENTTGQTEEGKSEEQDENIILNNEHLKAEHEPWHVENESCDRGT